MDKEKAIFHHILVPVDGSEPSNAGIALALRLAKEQRASVTFVHAIETAKITAMTSTSPMDPRYAIEAVESSAKAFLDEARAHASGSGVPIETVMVDGDCISCILDLARKLKADLLVVGSHGRGGVPRAILGSVAEGLLRRSEIPVLVTHLPPNR